MLDGLAEVEMHCIQTSGNCIRNVTADHFAGVAADEIEDPRPTRRAAPPMVEPASGIQLPAAQVQDRGDRRRRGPGGDRACTISACACCATTPARSATRSMVGGGLGRTPMIGKIVREFLPEAELLAYLEAILRVYNLDGRRDNKYKARIKILVHELGAEAFARRGRGGIRRASTGARSTSTPARRRPHRGLFRAARLTRRCRRPRGASSAAKRGPGLRPLGSDQSSPRTRSPGYAIVTISLKPIGGAAGRRHRRSDARRGRSRRALLVRRIAGHATCRTSSCRMSRRTICRRSGRLWSRPASPPPMSG